MTEKGKTDVLFRDLAGKTVEAARYEENTDWQSLSLIFTDGTLFSVEFSARVTVQARSFRARKGELKPIHNYGQISRNFGQQI